MIGDKSATELRQCLLDAHAMKEALAKNAVHRRQQLLSIGYCLEKLDRLQSMSSKKATKSKKSAKKSSKKNGKKSAKKNGKKDEEEIEELEETEEDGDQESEDLVLASALELLNVDPKAAEERGPDYIQRQLVEMGMQLRKRGQEETASVRSQFESCHKYCAGATVTRVADIGKHRAAYTAASKHASTLRSKLLRSKGAFIEARRFFSSARDTAKTRLDAIRSDLTLVHTLSDHVAALEAGSAAPAVSR